MQALNIAATGMMAQQLNVEVISNNIANMRTTGFKRQRAEFQDLLYQNLVRAGSASSSTGSTIPAGIQVGVGVKTGSTYRIMTQGSLVNTEKPLDVGIRGKGFYQISMPDGRTAYTRDGAFALDSTGTLVNQQGYALEPQITIPTNALDVSINAEGLIQVTTAGSSTPTDVGQMQLARFINTAGLEAIGDNLYLETAASGTATTGNPGTDGMGGLLQNFLEQSNVNAVSEISDLIMAQRAYEMNSKVITAADEMMRATSNLR
ncbi:MAG: flagellar basal-body rod protein FlgG [Hyphomicrobiales bacterium]